MINNFLDIKVSIEKNGYYLVQNFLKEKDIQNLTEVLDKEIKKNSKKSFISLKIVDYIKSIIKFDINDIKKFYLVNKIKYKYSISRIASEILGKKNELYIIDSYKSEKNLDMIIPWHTDQAYSGKENIIESEFVNPDLAALKFFFYLSDVDSDNGCLGYIPGSHKISYFLKKLIKDKQIEYSKYWSLNDYRNLIMSEKVRRKLLNHLDTSEIENFINQSSFIEKGDKDTKQYDIKAPRGSLLIFDESGIHRGAALKKSDRICLRYFFRKVID